MTESKACPGCGETKPYAEFHRRTAAKDGLQSWCKACKKASELRRRDAYRERRNSASNAWKRRHPERMKEYRRRRYEANAEEARAYSRKRRREHPEVLAAWKEKNPDYGKEHYRANRSVYRAYKKKRDALLRGAKSGERITHEEVAARDGWRCHICGARVTRKTWSLDHLIPVADGGPHSRANVALAHAICNKRRSRNALPAQLRLIG